MGREPQALRHSSRQAWCPSFLRRSLIRHCASCVNTGCVICLWGPTYAEGFVTWKNKDLFLSQNFNT